MGPKVRQRIPQKTDCPFFILSLIFIVALILFIYWNRSNYFEETVHSSNIWATIEDSKGNLIAIDFRNTINNVWDTLVKLNRNQTKIFIGGAVEQYANIWGFHFKLDSVVISQSAPEDKQATIRQIGANLSYWESRGEVYIYAKVVEIHVLVAIN
jgi:hypothetical protein